MSSTYATAPVTNWSRDRPVPRSPGSAAGPQPPDDGTPVAAKRAEPDNRGGRRDRDTEKGGTTLDTTGGRLGYRLIGALKLLSGLLLAAAGFGIFKLLNTDLGTTLNHVIGRLHLDPENRVVHEAAARVAGVTQSQLKAIGAGTFFYAFLGFLEGTGLILQKRWASYLTIVITASLLPFELYELALKVTPIRLLVLAVNLAILAYLVVMTWREKRSGVRG